jgi:hypothetical protein
MEKSKTINRFPNHFSLEKNEQILNHQKQCKEKQLYLYCWVSYLGVIHIATALVIQKQLGLKKDI